MLRVGGREGQAMADKKNCPLTPPLVWQVTLFRPQTLQLILRRLLGTKNSIKYTNF